MERYKDHGMPWVEAVIRRLPSTLSKPERLTVLTFVSCIGMVMNNDYVSFEQLKVLAQDLPMPQSKLQSLLILGRILLRKVVGLYMWSLHSSIPYRMAWRAQAPRTVLV